ncbi:Ig-like protein group 3 [Aquimarina sp. MAR_2010_214]|uniref:GEVED domain-containing protein n=1 Tax=Aquimarina sp. MAR_2010_214 TaxID=1250026 RepID=UPI000C704C1D|nr:GEVED domain-containing protein [Aquimarina sp. MAR_2010_214]PKV50194.1 Ig-like protein group 3 [Aquimarina sp. MAR_2010_214]
MNKKLLTKVLLASIIFILGLQVESYAQTKEKPEKTEIKQETEEFYTKEELEELKALQKELEAIALREKEEALRLAKIHGWEIRIKKADGTFIELQKVVDGKPIYNTTNGIKTTKSTRINHLQSGGSLGLNLMGQGMTAYVWDAGKVRTTHQEFDGAGGNNRVSMIDDKASELDDHAQHVTGIIVASGVEAKAKGVAPHIKAKISDWNNDEAEVTKQSMKGMLVSNHSYNTKLRNNKTGAVDIPLYYFGGYIDESSRWDNIMFKASKYLMVVSADNSGSDNTANKNPNSGFGFDKLVSHSTAKNNLLVANAQDVHVDENGNFISAIIDSSSSQGPTDDFRIKPDITAVGHKVYSTISSNNKAYGEKTGTSMAAPSVTGSLLLLQQHHKNVHKKYMKAATLKGLALHTADDAGVKGPDAIFGWGVLNARKAAQTITQKGKEARIEELKLKQGQTYKITVTSDGTNPLLASISWADRPGIATKVINSRTPVLVNDLDLRISKNSTTYLPYKLTGATTNAKTDNNVDPFERIAVNGASGTYTITVTHKGTLTGGDQNFSLIITGINDDASKTCNAVIPKKVSTSSITTSSVLVNWDKVLGELYNVRYRKVGTPLWKTKTATDSPNYFEIKGLSALTRYEVQVQSKCASENSAYSTSVNFTTYCESKATNGKDQYISKVVLNTINNPSTDTKGYSDYTSISTKLTKEATNTITITPKSTASEAGYGVWIDYNQDGKFEDTEKVFTKLKSKDAQVSRTFIVLPSAKIGTTKMRVVLKKNGTPTACETFAEGEVEDYTVTIVPKDTIPPTTPKNLKVGDDISKTGFDLLWEPSIDNIKGEVKYQVIENGSIIIDTVKKTSINLTNPTDKSNTYTIKAIDNSGNISAASNAVTVKTRASDYCTAKATSKDKLYIKKVELGCINTFSIAGTGYIDQTKYSLTDVIKGESNKITITPNHTRYKLGYGVWIDYNKDGKFEDTEKVWSMNPSKVAKAIGNFTIPSTVEDGKTRMRVVLKREAAPNVCETFAEGEVEDHTIYIITTDTKSPTTPSNVTASNVTQTSARVSWSTSIDNIGVTEYEILSGETILSTTTNAYSAITGLKSNTPYTLTVRAKDKAGNVSATSNTVTFTTYCASKATNATNQYIQKVVLGSIDNPSTGGDGYSDHTSIATNLAIGIANKITITPKNTASKAGYGIWIDYNQDGDFDDTDEKVWTKTSKDVQVSRTFTVPPSVKIGRTRMRVILKNGDAPTTACGTIAAGEVEEYTVNIVSKFTETESPTVPGNVTVSNISQTSGKLNWEASKDNRGVAEYEIFRDGKLIHKTRETSYTINGLTPKTSYTLAVLAKDAAGNTSLKSKAVTFKTHCIAKATNATNQYIKKVELGTIDHYSTSDGGYSDYTSISTKLAKGATNTIAITPKNTTSDAWYAVWIDYNRDGKFEEREKVWNKAKSKEAKVSGTFTVSSTAKLGKTTMRVVLQNNGTLTACGTFAEGEVEDYTVTIVKEGVDVTPHTAIRDLKVFYVTQTSVKLVWTKPAASEGSIEYVTAHLSKSFTYGTIETSAPQNSMILTGLEPNTEHTVNITVEDAAGNTSKLSNTVTFTTLCKSKATNGKDQYISKVVLGNIDNTSTDTEGYSDYATSEIIGTNLAKETANTITITPKSTTSDAWYAVWIDYDRNGKFEETEKVLTKNKSKEASASDTFTIPVTVENGSATMRVAISNKKINNACSSFEKGEVEDYTINIVPKGSDVTPHTAPTNLTASNRTQTGVKLSWDAYSNGGRIESIKLDIDPKGYKFKPESISQTSAVLIDLKPNTTYTVSLRVIDEAGNLSKKSNTVTFTTYCESKATNGKEQYISKVVLGNIDNTSTETGGYSDYVTSETIRTNLAKEKANTITITPKSTTSDAWYAVWIDYDRNGKFEETEKVLTKNKSKEAQVNGTFTISSSAKTGATRMRVVLNNKKAPTTACETFEEGEVEDYTINIVPKGSDVTPPKPASNVKVSYITLTSATLTYDDIQKTNKDIGGIKVFNTSDSKRIDTKDRFYKSLKMINLKPNTTYTVEVYLNDKAGNFSKPSNPVTFTTLCVSKATNGKDQYINKVVLGSINKTSTGGDGYSDYTSISTRVTKGDSNTITITPKSITSEAGYGVWIDYDQNGKFDNGEKVWTEASKEAQVSGTFIVPSSAKTGATRMRVVLNNKEKPKTACGTFEEGEVEDYTINIIPVAPSNLVVTNITQTGAKFSWDASEHDIENIRYSLYDNKIKKRVGPFTTNTFNNITGLKPNTTYALIVYAIDNSGNFSEDSNTVTFKTLCESKAINAKDQYIQKVVLGGIDNSSTNGKGYVDYTSISTKLAKEAVNTITITPKISASKAVYGVWIDYNQDGNFDDEGEKVWTEASKEAKVSGTFIVPSSVKTGATRMRVVLNNKEKPTDDACGTFEEGEVEDYTVIIVPKDTELPTAPTNLAVSDILKTGATISWSASKDNFRVTQYEVFNGETSLGSTTSTTYKVPNLKPNTTYTVNVKAKDNSGNVSKASKAVTFKTQDAPYCVSKGNSSLFNTIKYVSFGGITSTESYGSGYSDFTAKIATVTKGNTHNIRIKSESFTNSADKYSLGVWIDFNKNRIFESNEKVVNVTSDNGNMNVKNDIAVPLDAILGKTRMRIIFKSGGKQTACETFEEGEVEDYTVTIIDSPTSTNRTALTNRLAFSNVNTQTFGNEVMVYPNPASDYIKVKLRNAKAENLTYRIINIFGQVVKQGKLNGGNISITDIKPATYILEVDNGQKPIRTRFVKK